MLLTLLWSTDLTPSENLYKIHTKLIDSIYSLLYSDLQKINEALSSMLT